MKISSTLFWFAKNNLAFHVASDSELEMLRFVTERDWSLRMRGCGCRHGAYLKVMINPIITIISPVITPTMINASCIMLEESFERQKSIYMYTNKKKEIIYIYISK